MDAWQRKCAIQRRFPARSQSREHLLACTAVLVFAFASPTSVQCNGPVVQLRGVENLGTGASLLRTPKAKTPKVAPELLALLSEYQAYLQQANKLSAATPAFKSRMGIMRVAGGSVVIDTAASDDPEVLAVDLRALGASRISVFGRMVSTQLPISSIEDLKRLSTLQLARPAYAATLIGEVTSQGDGAMRADMGRVAFGIDGTGVLVGTLSDSFDCLGGAAAGIASGDLPAGVIVLDELSSCIGATDEGRGMMEIIHDVAPGARLAFHTALEGQASFAQGIIDLADAGAMVINDDVIYFTEPFYQDGIIAQAVNTVKAQGVAYFSSAGNAGRKAYESPFRPSGRFLDIGFGPAEAHDFDPGADVDFCQQITIPADQRLIVDYQWDQPFFSVSGMPGSGSDMDIILTDATCSAILAGVASGNLGGDPVEVFGFTNAGPATLFGIILLHLSGPAPGVMKTVLVGSRAITIDEFATETGTSWGHSASLGGLGVAAADYHDTPAFGKNPPRIESFSSAGGTPILFDAAGNRLAVPEIRQQPDITAPDGADTTFFGSDTDATGFPNFFGTSAAAPHATGVAALMKDLVPSLTPDGLYAALKGTAIDMDDPATGGFDAGFDFGTGFGLIEANAALDALGSPQADLSLAISDAPDPVAIGQALTYSITASNNGPSQASDVTVTDSLGAGINFEFADPSQGDCDGTSTVTCTLGGIGSGASATVSIRVRPSGAGIIVNGATVTGREVDPTLSNNFAQVTTTIEAPSTPKVDLSITMADAPDPSAVGERLTYAVTVANKGPDTATGVRITDLVPSAIAIGLPAQDCSGPPIVECDLGALVSGASASVILDAVAREAGEVKNHASVRSNGQDLNPSNNSAFTSTTVNAIALTLPPHSQQQNTCTAVRCSVRMSCMLGTPCSNGVTLWARVSTGRERISKTPLMVRFAVATMTNVRPGATQPVRLNFTRRGRKIARQSIRNGTRALRGRIEIARSLGGGALSIPITVKFGPKG